MSDEVRDVKIAAEEAAAEIRARHHAASEIRRALEAYDGSATQLAKAAGVSPSTITRPLKDPMATSMPKWATIVKILHAAGLKPVGYGGPLKAPSNIQIVEVVGEIRPGVWFEDAESRMYGADVMLGMRGAPLGTLSAYIVGPEEIPYPAGTRAIVHTGLQPRSGDFVVFRRTRGELIETSAAMLVEAGPRSEFWKTHADGRIEKFAAGAGPSDEIEGLGVSMGTVVATVWARVE